MHPSIYFQWSLLYRERGHDLIGPYSKSRSLILGFHIPSLPLSLIGYGYLNTEYSFTQILNIYEAPQTNDPKWNKAHVIIWACRATIRF